MLDSNVLEALTALATPTICNALEVVEPKRRGHGYNIRPFVCAHPQLKPIVGYARTARIRAQHAPSHSANMIEYYRYIQEGGPQPSIVLIEDLDDTPGYGAFWGEVNTNVHYGLGCLGVVTNGSVRDLPDAQANFQMLAGMVNPSHAFVHVVDFGGPVTLHGMEAKHDDLIHADQHGAVVIPEASVEAVIAEAKTIAAREHVLISAAQQPGFSISDIEAAYAKMADIH
ncbi:MAG: RraA family protein [Pseudomonadales bacterium]